MWNQVIKNSCSHAVQVEVTSDPNLFAVSGRLVSPSSDDSVSSLSLDDTSTFSYCNSRSNRKLRSRLALSRRRCVDRRASWKHSFSCKKYFYMSCLQISNRYALNIMYYASGLYSESVVWIICRVFHSSILIVKIR